MKLKQVFKLVAALAVCFNLASANSRGEIKKDGVISDCHAYAIETNRIKEASKEAGASYMSLETDCSKQDVGQIRTRLEAFIELL